MMRVLFTEMGNVPHHLSVIRKDEMKLPFTKVCNVTHSLFKTIGKDILNEIAFHKNV